MMPLQNNDRKRMYNSFFFSLMVKREVGAKPLGRCRSIRKHNGGWRHLCHRHTSAFDWNAATLVGSWHTPAIKARNRINAIQKRWVNVPIRVEKHIVAHQDMEFLLLVKPIQSKCTEIRWSEDKTAWISVGGSPKLGVQWLTSGSFPAIKHSWTRSGLAGQYS